MNVRDLFPGYYQPTEEDFTELWKECVFSFDTNVLLHIYRYSPKTRERLFDILQKLQERIWIPHQVAYEIHKNKLTVISKQFGAYKEIQKILDGNLNIGSLKDQLVKNYKNHPYIDVSQIIETIEVAIAKVKKDLQVTQEEHPDLVKDEELWNKLIDIIDGRVGKPYCQDKLKEVYKQAEQRFKDLIPPGYKDIKDKPIPDRYGDPILWLQLIDHAKTENKSIIFVTDDKKEDWWLEHNGKTISPRPELVQEMLTEAGVKFYMYQSDKFLEYAEDFLKLPEQPEVIEEAREIREQNTNYVNLISEARRLNITELNKLISPITAPSPLFLAELDKLRTPITEPSRLLFAELDKLITFAELDKLIKPITEDLRLNLKESLRLKPLKELGLNPDDYKLP
ncbi:MULTISPECIES: PIN domain-containing protein [unclassified Nodularia (in: cyanobacteria)]|uniref:PIN domain-containing protein n=1 Tax=unclassified Nodularia (in: cyanobacteria) TaxID=2656917 RepID=UPI001882E06F|nr:MULTISPECIES: PIN domain-containing protein [unclassified Nodularia (in: cyanobacteria)]MBE9201108.1 DUF4935 domain-containing protein [Nodularia sp. LEGE 06071]MCC2694821.1 DUF4935 domain-containing protein [Nodularia sp. LEGE 04288]